MKPDFTRPILAVDTSTAYLSLALSCGNRLLHNHTEAGNRHAEHILPAINRLFAEADCSAADLAALVYAQGPGAFTGLRIGAGIVQGLAAPFGTPLIGIPCLDAVAALRPDHTAVLAAQDARMGEVFYAWYDTVNHTRLSPYLVGKADAIRLPENLSGQATHTVCGIGNAFSLPEPPPYPGCGDMPTASDYLALAATGRYPPFAAAQAQLLYVRDKVALTASEQAARKQKS